ncbi:MAG: hypothetical protein IJD95_02690 [Clostridia bacterium]|nr:hypothetical protein [Clostridia bacterium]
MKQKKEIKLFGLSLDSRELLVFIFLLAVVFRMFYGVMTGPYTRQHDFSGTHGHYEYVKIIANEGALPKSNDWQFYHPPLTHIVLAGGYALLSGVIVTPEGAPDDAKIADILQVFPFIYSVLMLFVIYFILKELGLKGGYLLLGFSIFAFHPTNIILSASLNNDMLTYLLYGVSFLFTVKWYKEQSFFNIICLALSIAASMLSKFSGVMIAPLTAIVFLTVLIKYVREKKSVGGLIAQFAIFGVICIPLGLSYTLRNYILFEQPLGYVAYMGKDNWQYIDKPLISRLFGYWAPDLDSPFSDLYRHNILSTCFKTSLFGEWGGAFSGFSSRFGAAFTELAGWVVTFFAAVFTAVSAFLSGKYLFGGKQDGVFSFLLVGNFVLQFGFFIYFNAGYPFGCTADFRYLAPTLISLSALFPLGLKKVKSNLLKQSFIATAICFSLASSAFYMLCA